MTAQKRGATDNQTYDWGLVSIVATLLAFGAVMVFSAGFAQGIYGLSNPYYFFVYQLIWIALGIVAMVVAAHSIRHLGKVERPLDGLRRTRSSPWY